MIRPVLHHVTIKTRRLQEMVDWYRLVVGVEVTFQDANNAWTTNDAANHRIAFLSVPGLSQDADKVAHTGLHHTAFEYGSFDDLIASHDRLRADGVEPAFALDHGMTISLYYQDPEGNYVELQSDSMGGWAASSEWMRNSPEFRSNPIGTFFNPAKVSAAHAAGRPFSDLQPAIRAGAFLPDLIPPMGLPI